jgi:hypothetical protein
MRAAAAHDPRRKRRNQPLAVRRLPALAPIARRFGLQHQVLNDNLLEALGARARRGLDRKRHLPVDRKLGDARAAPALRRLVLRVLRAALRPFRRLLHSGRLVGRTRRQMLQPRDLVLQRLVLNPLPRHRRAELLVLRLQPLHFAKQSANQADQLSRRHAFKRIIRVRRHARA